MHNIYLSNDNDFFQQVSQLESDFNIVGFDGDDTIYILGDGKDTLHGGDGKDTLYGGGGDDILLGGRDNDFLLGGSGNDLIKAGSGNDRISLGDGNDTAYGHGGDDSFNVSGDGNDLLFGGDGNDSFTISNPNSTQVKTVWGNQGEDTFAVYAYAGGGIEIKDYQPHLDTLIVIGGSAELTTVKDGSVFYDDELLFTTNYRYLNIQDLTYNSDTYFG